MKLNVQNIVLNSKVLAQHLTFIQHMVDKSYLKDCSDY